MINVLSLSIKCLWSKLLLSMHMISILMKGMFTIMKIAGDISWIDAENELYVINAKTNKCLVLDEVGKEIWHEILKVDNLDELIKYFQNKFDNDEHAKIEKDIQEMYDLLISMEILCKSEEE